MRHKVIVRKPNGEQVDGWLTTEHANSSYNQPVLVTRDDDGGMTFNEALFAGYQIFDTRQDDEE